MRYYVMNLYKVLAKIKFMKEFKDLKVGDTIYCYGTPQDNPVSAHVIKHIVPFNGYHQFVTDSFLQFNIYNLYDCTGHINSAKSYADKDLVFSDIQALKDHIDFILAFHQQRINVITHSYNNIINN